MSALLAFEAVARHLSVTRASLELNLTQTAVSHQIKSLESQLGVRLFLRKSNGIELTAPAKVFLELVRDSLVDISDAVERVSRIPDANRIRIQSMELFAIKRLIPLLPDFRQRHPDIVIELRTTQAFDIPLIQDFDVALWHGDGNWPDVEATMFWADEIFPVCSPALVEAQGEVKSPQDLSRFTVIRNSSRILGDEWPFWLNAAGCSTLKFKDELCCNNLSTSVQACVEGLGIMLGRSGVIGADLESGQLVELLASRFPSPSNYFFVTPGRNPPSPATILFRDWLLDAFEALHGRERPIDRAQAGAKP